MSTNGLQETMSRVTYCDEEEPAHLPGTHKVRGVSAGRECRSSGPNMDDDCPVVHHGQEQGRGLPEQDQPRVPGQHGCPGDYVGAGPPPTKRARMAAPVAREVEYDEGVAGATMASVEAELCGVGLLLLACQVRPWRHLHDFVVWGGACGE